MSKLDDKLKCYNLWRNTSYKYNVGDCLFDSIAYLLGYAQSSTNLQINAMHHLKICLAMNIAKACETWSNELNESFLRDLHKGVILNEDEYIEKMSICATIDGLWGDFTTIKWISDCLTKQISVWNKENG